MTLNFDKLVAAIHYICEKSSGTNKLDQIKLNKILWYSDAMAYLGRGYSITGETYIRKPFGPVAKRNRQAIKELEDSGSVKKGKSSNDSGNWQDQLDAISDADKTLFDGVELQILDETIKSVLNKDSTGVYGISERTHGEIWELADDGEEIPLFTVFAEKLGAITKKHIADATASLH